MLVNDVFMVDVEEGIGAMGIKESCLVWGIEVRGRCGLPWHMLRVLICGDLEMVM